MDEVHEVGCWLFWSAKGTLIKIMALLNQSDVQTEDGHAMVATQCVGASVTSAKKMSAVDTWRLQHCQHRGATKDGHSLLLLKSGFITCALTDREVVGCLLSLVHVSHPTG